MWYGMGFSPIHQCSNPMGVTLMVLVWETCTYGVHHKIPSLWGSTCGMEWGLVLIHLCSNPMGVTLMVLVWETCTFGIHHLYIWGPPQIPFVV
jgi:hypothetical protein